MLVWSFCGLKENTTVSKKIIQMKIEIYGHTLRNSNRSRGITLSQTTLLLLLLLLLLSLKLRIHLRLSMLLLLLMNLPLFLNSVILLNAQQQAMRLDILRIIRANILFLHAAELLHDFVDLLRGEVWWDGHVCAGHAVVPVWEGLEGGHDEESICYAMGRELLI